MLQRKEVRNSPEVARILNLPRRTVDGTELVQPLTEALRTPHGTWTLRPLQAQALYDMGTVGGFFGPLRVGSGKTLITLLAPLLLEARRPVLLLPAALIGKTEDERRQLTKHWKIPSSTRLISYTKLGIVSGIDELNFYRPDLIIADECHKLKNKRAGVTRRVLRYMKENPECKFVAVSGTVMKDSIKDFAHIMRWCLKEHTPLPRTEEELEDWANALDPKQNFLKRVDPGPLVQLCLTRTEVRDLPTVSPKTDGTGTDSLKTNTPNWSEGPADVARYVTGRSGSVSIIATTPNESEASSVTGVTLASGSGLQLSLKNRPEPTLEEIRRGFQNRLLETPGVVGSTGDQVACSLLVEGHVYQVNDETEKAFKTLREFWETPDGWAFSEAVDLWRHARELALGFWYRWDPRPPREWLEARKAWASKVREILSRSRTLDTELQVVQAVDAGQAPGAELLAAWRGIKDTFIPKTKAVWHDMEPMRWVTRWMEKGPGIVWTSHNLFAEALAKETGLPYFGANAEDKNGRPIREAHGAIIASVDACSTGQNLQKWHRNLITSVPSNAPIWEQLLGRTHRDGQTADEVTVDLMIGCAEHLNGLEKSRGAARAQQDMLGHTQKLLLADIVLPPGSKTHLGHRWTSMNNRLD